MTAIEWLYEQIDNKDMGEIPMWIYDFCNQALEMEKEQIGIGCWVSVNDAKPTKDGSYLTYIQNSKYDNIGFTQFIDGEFMSSFVTHWTEVSKP